jgi:hypothetical protein
MSEKRTPKHNKKKLSVFFFPRLVSPIGPRQSPWPIRQNPPTCSPPDDWTRNSTRREFSSWLTSFRSPVRQSEPWRSRATWHVHAADVITSTVRPIRRLSAQIGPEQEGYVCSSGFVVLTPTDVAPEVLLTFLRLPAICELMDLYTSASMYPAISETDILALPFPTIQTSTSNAICMAVQQSRETRQRARDLLNRAKHAVEIAIEDSEAAALRFLDEAGA